MVIGDGEGDGNMDTTPDPPLFSNAGSDMDIDYSYQRNGRKSRKSSKRIRAPQGNRNNPIGLTEGQVICVDGRFLEA